MKTLAVITALFLNQPGVEAPKQSMMPNVLKVSSSESCGQQPATPPGCISGSAKCIAGNWEWTC